MSLANKEESKRDDTDSIKSSASDNSSNVSSSVGTSCCETITATTSTTTTSTTDDSELDAIEDLVTNQSPATAIALDENNTTDESNALVENARDLIITRSQPTKKLQCDNPIQLKRTDCSSATTLGKQIEQLTKTTIPSTSKADISGVDRLASGKLESVVVATKSKSIGFLRYTPSPTSPPLSPIECASNDGDDNCKVAFRNISPASTATSLGGRVRSTNLNKLNLQQSKLQSVDAHSKQQHAIAQENYTVSKNSKPPNVCDCLAQNCQEKEHSNRRQFIEHYYNSRTRLPSSSSNATSSALNINTPLNRLSECDAITKRLLSSPVRGMNTNATRTTTTTDANTANTTQSPGRRRMIQANDELDKSRRASLGTNALSDQVSIFTKSNQFNSLELNYRRQLPGGLQGDGGDDDVDEDNSASNNYDKHHRGLAVSPTSELDIRLKHTQGRSLSVCHEETLKPRFRNSNTSSSTNNNNNFYRHHHSSNLNRTVSLACDSGSSRRLPTIIPLFGCDISTLEQFIKFGLILPPPIDLAVDYILAHGNNSIGIFRKSGVRSRILTLRRRIEADQYITLDQLNQEIEFSIYDIADLVKMWLRELKPVPIMTKRLIDIISGHLTTKQAKCSTNQDQDQRQQINSSSQKLQQSYEATVADSGLRKQIKSSVSPTHRALFSKILDFFSKIASNNDANQMTSQNLAICLTPSLCATGADQESIIVAQKALKYCLDNYRSLF